MTPIPFSAGLQNLDVEDFLRHAYMVLLGRPADAVGLRDYVRRIEQGISRAQVWQEIASGEEARQFATRSVPGGQGSSTGVQTELQTMPIASAADLLALEGSLFVQQAYRHILGREADPTGLQGYMARLEAGTSREQIVADLRCDPEGKAFASRLPGLDAVVQAVQRRAGTAVFDSSMDPFDALLSLAPASFIDQAFQMLLQRMATDDERALYAERMRLQGYSKMYVLHLLADLPQARQRVAQIPHLAKRLRNYRNAQKTTWGGWAWREIHGIESDLPQARERRAILAQLRTE